MPSGEDEELLDIPLGELSLDAVGVKTISATATARPTEIGSSRSRTEQWMVQLGLLNDSTARHELRQGYRHVGLTHAAHLASYASRSSDQPHPPDAVPVEADPLASDSTPDGGDLDPLSAMVQEQTKALQRQEQLELQYKRDKALRKTNGAATSGMADETVDPLDAYHQLILKDLHRLPHPHIQQPLNQQRYTVPQRHDVLHHVLLLFAATHVTAGYLQGMHEIASYVLYALELETTNDATAETNDDMTADCFVLTERILTGLFVAYDVAPCGRPADTVPPPTSRLETPMPQNSSRLEQMAQRVVGYTQGLDCSDGTHSTSLHAHLHACFAHVVPPTLIFTKWIRLLLSREVCQSDDSEMTHADVVVQLWDDILAAVHDISVPPRELDATVSSLQTVAEAYCAARLWYHASTIFHLSAYPDVLLQWFMNIPPEDASSRPDLVQRMRYLLRLANAPPPPHHLTCPLHVLAMTASLHPPISHPAVPHGTVAATTTPSLWDTLAVAAPRLSSWTEHITATTQSLQKRMHEWEHNVLGPVPSPHADPSRRTLAARPTPPSPTNHSYNLDYYTTDMSLRQMVQGPTTTTVPQPVEFNVPVSSANVAWSMQLQPPITMLQQFVTHLAQEPTSRVVVPPSVWEALADLQRVQQDMQKSGR